MGGLKRLLVWLKRFRYRCGYGVHSPFAFDFITNVVYEKTPYYAYQQIEQVAIDNKDGRDIKKNILSPKVNQFLFRLVNRMQPTAIIDAGGSGKTTLYLQAGKKTAGYVPITSSINWETLGQPENIFLYIGWPDKPQLVETLFNDGVGRVGQKSVFVIQGIYNSSAMKELWKRLVVDERVGITFDLYDLGVLFFDKSKIKQHYIVNF